jgi:thioesterase domain-containing protein
VTGAGRVPGKARQNALAQCIRGRPHEVPRRQDFLDSLPFVTNLGTTKDCKMANKNTPKTAPSKIATPAAPAAKATASYKPTQEEIAARAFEIYQRYGGNDQENWLRAERELIARGRR